MESTALSLAYLYTQGANKRRLEWLERYERQLTATAALPNSSSAASSSSTASSGPHVKKARHTPLQRYLSTKPASCVKIVFQSDEESDSDDDESLTVRPSLSDGEEEEPELDARAPAKKSNVAKKVAATGQANDPIVLSDDDDDDNESANRKATKGGGSKQGIPALMGSSPNSKVVTPSGNHKAQSPTKGRTVSSESSCDSSAMSSVMETPDTKPPGRGRGLMLRKPARRLHDEYDFPDSGEESQDYDSEDSEDSESESSSDDESVDSEQEANVFYCSAPPEDPDSPFTLADFKNLWRLCEKNLGEKTEVIEGGRLIRQANTKMVSEDSNAQCKAQYGRILPNATNKLLKEILKVERDDVFVDVGHGIGNAVLQAAYTIGCESRGIEVVGDRNFIALRFKKELDDLRRIRQDVFDDPRGEQVGTVDLRHGRLELPDSRDFITNPGRRTKAFVNNFDGVFAERSAKPGQMYHLDHFIAGLFAIMEPGSIMVTLHPLTLGHSLDSANEVRSRHGLDESDLASFFRSETVTLGEARDVVSWSQGGSCRNNIQVYVYTRLEQPTGGAAVFLCNNPNCVKAQDKEPQAAVGLVDADGEGERLVIAECDCGLAPRPLRSRKRVDYNSNMEYVQWPF